MNDKKVINSAVPLDFSILSTYQPLVKCLQNKLPQLLAIYAFGSQVQGTANSDSDLDLAVLVTTYVNPLELWDIAGQLVDLTGCHVDLLDMRASSTVMQYQILQTSQLLWAKQPESDIFECFILSEKTALDEARSELLDDIVQRGSVYG